MSQALQCRGGRGARSRSNISVPRSPGQGRPAWAWLSGAKPSEAKRSTPQWGPGFLPTRIILTGRTSLPLCPTRSAIHFHCASVRAAARLVPTILQHLLKRVVERQTAPESRGSSKEMYAMFRLCHNRVTRSKHSFSKVRFYFVLFLSLLK